jgi:hypothetical protein
MTRLIEPLLEFALGCALGVTLTLLLIDAILRTGQ